MKCEICGCDYEPGAKFCSECGAQISEKPAEGKDKTRKKSMVLGSMKFIVPVILVLAAILIVLPMLNGSGASDSINFFADGDAVIVSANNDHFTIDGKMRSHRNNIAGDKAVLLTDYNYDSGGTLWFVTTTGYFQISEDVLDYKISDSGNGVAYLTDYGYKYDFAALYLYDTVSKKGVRITDEAYSSIDVSVCISPNGKSIAYMGDYNSSDDSFTGYIKINGKPVEKLGDNMFAVAISDGGKYIYYAKKTKDGDRVSLYVKSGHNDNRLISDLTGYTNPWMTLNKDYSQAILNSDDKLYISRNGKDRTKISNDAIQEFVVPRKLQHTDNRILDVYGVSSFTNTLALNSNGIFYINNKFEPVKIIDNTSYVYNVFVSSDGKTLLFIDHKGNLTAIDLTKVDANAKEIVEEVKTFIATDDGKTIYYVNVNNELWCIKGDGKPSKISDDVFTNYLTLSDNNRKLFFLVDYDSAKGGELYFTNNGRKKLKVSGGSDVMGVWSTPANIFYLTIDSDLYRSNGNEIFTLFQEDATIGH